MQTTQDTIARHDAHMSINYGRYPVVIASGAGCRLTDADGKSYLDLFAGFGAPVLGHCHPELVAAVTEQAQTLWHVGNLFHTDPQTRAAKWIADLGFGGRSFFCHSGADANEAALKLARLYGNAHRGASTGEHGRYKVISCTQSFHGRSFATMGATGNPKVSEGFGPLLAGYTNVAYNDLEAVRAALDPETVAVIAEPIQGEGGVNLPDADYFKTLRALCDEHDLLLICDEVWTGCGRTGKPFAHQHWGVTPDIMTLGKGVGGGLAVGVMCAQDHVAEFYNAFTQGGVKHATTLGGNCLSMAVTAKIFEIIERDGLCAHAAAMGDHATQRIAGWDDAGVQGVRGHGLFLGVQLAEGADGAGIARRALDAGLLINATQGNVLRIAPPITITQGELDEGLDLLHAVLKA